MAKPFFLLSTVDKIKDTIFIPADFVDSLVDLFIDIPFLNVAGHAPSNEKPACTQH